MKLLLDSNALYWRLLDDPRLSPKAHSLIDDPESEIAVSVATIWELEIKRRKAKLAAKGSFLVGVRASHLTVWSIEAEDAEAAAALPRHHDDPFDRMIIAQARRRGFAVMTADAAFSAYDVERVAASA